MANMDSNDTVTDTEIDTNTILITKIVLDFDDALFPSHCYKQHEILKYHESTSTESVETGRDLFKHKEPKFMKLKKNIDLVIFKLMQLYSKDNFVILSTGDYQWIESTLAYYNYLLSAYNISIYSTQEWHKKHPNDFNINCSLEAKSFLMKMLLNKWKKEAQLKYKSQIENDNKVIKFRLISIGDSFFEFLCCYHIGFDYVNHIKLLEEPTVHQLINLWNKILYLCQSNIYNSNVVFIKHNEYYYLNNERMNALNEQCVNKINNNNNNNISLLDIIRYENNQRYEIKTDKNGKQYKSKIEIVQNKKLSQILYNNNNNNNIYNYNINYYTTPPSLSPLSPSPDIIANTPPNNNMNTTFLNNNINNELFYAQQQQLFYAQQLLQQQQQIQQQMQSQFIFSVPLPQYTNLNYYTDQFQYNNINTHNSYNYNMTTKIMTSNYTTNP